MSSELYNDILTFGFSFLILIAVWMRYTKIMSVLPLGFFTSLLIDDQKKLIPKEFQKEFTCDAATLFLAGALSILSGAVPITQTGIFLPLRFDFWIIPFLLLRISSRGTGAY
jgi:hypothetical protein